MSTKKRKPDPGIEVRHLKVCATRGGGTRCTCNPSYRPRVWDPTAGTKGRWIPGPSFKSEAAARNWRQDNQAAVRRGEIRAPTVQTVASAAEALIAGMASGAVLDRSGKPYKPATCRCYQQALRGYVVPALGPMRVSAVKRRDVQVFVDTLRADGLSARTVLNKLDPLRVIFRRAIRDDLVTVDPTVGLDLPRVRSKRDRIEDPAHAVALVEALPGGERAFWAMALFTGLRRGELRALRWGDVDLKGGVARVQRGWDDVHGEQEVKTDAGRRTVPLMGRVRRELAAHKLRTGRGDGDLVFGRTADLPFVPTTVRSRARKAWQAAGLDPLTPHEARHCAASYLIAAGVNAKELSTYIGHSDIRTTFNRYGHLMPGNETHAASKLDALFAETGEV
jgi:integrase